MWEKIEEFLTTFVSIWLKMSFTLSYLSILFIYFDWVNRSCCFWNHSLLTSILSIPQQLFLYISFNQLKWINIGKWSFISWQRYFLNAIFTQNDSRCHSRLYSLIADSDGDYRISFANICENIVVQMMCHLIARLTFFWVKCIFVYFLFKWKLKIMIYQFAVITAT